MAQPASLRSVTGRHGPDSLDDFTGIRNLDDNISTRDIEKQLFEYWQSLKFAGVEKGTGTIKNIVASGKSGFISGDNKKEYYFRVKEFHGRPDFLKPGMRVSFFIQTSEEPGKLDNAVNVKQI